ncbi:MAG: low molecular weight phosphotyrosine protein phosphatase [Alphaproteobacteria bacterium]|nr:low molecular weight phosphotyrosine protein phosphatase [Alphaproteobacteria bacterium]
MQILFVCLGNICRSPMAEGLFRHVAESRDLKVVVDSAGTSGWHVGDAPDPRGQATMRAHGIDTSAQHARQVNEEDFNKFDLVLAMDRRNHDSLTRLAGPGRASKVRLFLEFAPGRGDTEVPDPYYGGEDGFEHVSRYCITPARGWPTTFSATNNCAPPHRVRRRAMVGMNIVQLIEPQTAGF